MKTIAHSNIATRFSAVLALGLAAAIIGGSVTPAAAHKGGGGGGGHHGNPGKPSKPPQNPGPIGPLPKPLPQPPVVRDHRTPAPVVVRDHRTTPAPVVRDHRAGTTGGVTVTDSKTQSRGSVPCLGNMCGVTASVKRAIGNGIKLAKSGRYSGGLPR
jgi:hypothetical protein